jgi:hypothetical protein
MFCNGSRLSIVARMEEEAVRRLINPKSEIRNNPKEWKFQTTQTGKEINAGAEK